MVKENIYTIVKVFEREPCPAEHCDRGYDLYSVAAWDYPALLTVFKKAGETARRYHIPSMIHATHLTQPLGHSTSGSQERYEPPERLMWEAEYDCLRKFREWMMENRLACEPYLEAWETEDRQVVEESRKQAWEAYQAPLQKAKVVAIVHLNALAATVTTADGVKQAVERLEVTPAPLYRDQAG
jgi:2-oxoisovalerate dehydrogenase E1 component